MRRETKANCHRNYMQLSKSAPRSARRERALQPPSPPDNSECFSALNRFLFRRKMINKHGLSSSQSSTCYLHPFTVGSEGECSPQESFESFLAQKLCCEKERLQGGRPLSFGSSRHSRHLGFPTHSGCSQSAGT